MASSAGGLVGLAAQRRLPLHQHMDRATVEWITAQRPRFRPAVPPQPLGPVSRTLLNAPAVPADWYAEPAVYDTIHGVRHGMRVAALAALLAEAHGLGAEDTVTVTVAAAVHDCRRLHDREDTGHGRRASAWLTANAGTVWGHFGLIPGARNTAHAASAVRLHDVPYDRFGADDRRAHGRAGRLCDLLKAADALDRYRQPKLTWWPDRRHVREPLFEQMQPVAFELVVLSETARLAGAGDTEAVLHALAVKGLL